MTQQEPGSPPTIVVGVDGSAAGQAALRWAIKEATIRQGSVRALSVSYAAELTPATSMAMLPHGLTRPEADPVERAKWLTTLIDEARASVPGAAPVVGVPVTGDPVRELAKASAEADLVVVGSHGHGPLAEIFLGSVAAGTVRHARCPIVLIPARYGPHHRG